MNTQQERDSRSFCKMAVFTEMTNVLSTQSQGLLCVTERGFMMKLMRGARDLIWASPEDRALLTLSIQAVNLCRSSIRAKWEGDLLGSPI